MAPLRSLRFATAPIAPLRRAPTILRHRPLAQWRSMASKGEGEKDDLGGPGGQEPVDPASRAQQNAGYRNKTILGLILVGAPLFYFVTSPEKAADVRE